MDLVDDVAIRLIPLHRQTSLDFTRCKDPDWLEDLHDFCITKSFHKLLWICYTFPTLADEWAKPEQVKKIDERLDRCARIMEKCLMILRQIKERGETMGPHEFWDALTDREIEIIGKYPTFQAWLYYAENMNRETGIDITAA
jgi:hypothetical protein